MKTDIQIANEGKMEPIIDIANKIGIDNEYIENYGKYKAKLSSDLWDKVKNKEDGKLVLVTAINPTPAGEGKTTTTVGLGQAMNKLGVNAIIALREPSLGPCMGIKGGAAGGGYSQVLPMEDINLHFTGDIHAVSIAHNLLSAMIDNHLQQGNKLGIDQRQIKWKRVLDMNDRALRNIIVGLGGRTNGVPREDSFMISVASEVMAILCLAENLADLKKRLSQIIVAYTYDKQPVTAGDLKAEGAMAALLKDAIKPNLVQTLENTPAIVHGGPFANIAHGCSSVSGTKYALKLGDVAITEAGFGADLGAEKFFDIKCRKADLTPNAVVLVATIRALKYNGGSSLSELCEENLEALKNGFVNLEKHIENLQLYKIPIVVTLNAFSTDEEAEINYVKERCISMGCEFAISNMWKKGGEGGIELAEKVLKLLKQEDNRFAPLYDENDSIKEKILTICQKIYGARNIFYTVAANNAVKKIEEMGLDKMPVCIAKTQYSLTDNPKILGRPKEFDIIIREVNISAGAEFIVAITGNIMTMPGLPKRPSAEDIDIDASGNIIGLF